MSSLPQYDDEEDAPQRAQHRRSEEEWLYSGDGDDMGNSFASVPAQFEMDLKGSEEGAEEEQEQKQKQRQKRSGRFAFSKPIGYMHRAHGFDDNFNSKNADLDNPIPRSDRAVLCGRILEDVSLSVSKFRPSASIAASIDLMRGAGYAAPEIEIDVVMSGGGLKGYFMSGASFILLKELEKQNARIARVAGASAGAWAGLFMLTGFSTADWIETYIALERNPDLTLLEAYEEMWPFVRTLIPDDAYLHCSGRLFISITELTAWGPRNRMISHYDSNEDLFQACLASSTIPFLTERNGIRKYKDVWVCDGGFSNNTPVFEDGVRRQLVFRLYNVEYPWRLLTVAKDSCIEALVLRGAILMSRFLQGDQCGDSAITWLERKENQSPPPLARGKDSGGGGGGGGGGAGGSGIESWGVGRRPPLSLFRPLALVRWLLTPLTVSGMILTTGMRHLLQACGLVLPPGAAKARGVGGTRGGRGGRGGGGAPGDANIVPFDRLQKDTPTSYLKWVLWGSLVERLQRLGFLM